MRVARYFPLHLLILIITNSYLTTTDCADSGRKRDKNVYGTSSTPRGKRSRNVGGAASTSGEATKAGSSRQASDPWPRGIEDQVLTTYYNNFHNGTPRWKMIYETFKDQHFNLPAYRTFQNAVLHLIRSIYHNAPALGEGNFPWTHDMKSEIIRIYYQTRGGDKREHANKMYERWRNECPHFSDISREDLIHQAENMLIRNGLLKLPSALSNERMRKIYPNANFEFHSEQEDLLRKIYAKVPPNEKLSVEEFYDGLCKKDSRLCYISPRKVLRKAKYLLKNYERVEQTLQVPYAADEETNPSDQSHHSHEFLNTFTHQWLHPHSTHYHAEQAASSSSHQGSSHQHPDLDLDSESLRVGILRIRHPDVDPVLGDLRIREPNVNPDLKSSQKKKGKSVSKQGS